MASDWNKSVDDAVLKMIAQGMANMEVATIHLKSAAKKKITDLEAVDSGALRASIDDEVALEGLEVKGYIGTTLDYGAFVHQGTGIYAADGDGRQTPWAYKDPKTGQTVWTKGSKPRPFLQEAQDEEAKTINELLGGQ